MLHQTNDLTLFIAITSAPLHSSLRDTVRQTWLIPCRPPTCDYRFFIDRNVTQPSSLFEENSKYSDMVFRGNWCPFMEQRHPYPEINYGNHMNNVTSKTATGTTKIPNYPHRGFYKVDWKVCFSRWSLVYQKMASYHAYMEDDGFICIKNLLQQTNRLKHLNNSNAGMVMPLRTGYEMSRGGGFDDSSTLMSREVVMAFATLYPLERASGYDHWRWGFACPNAADFVSPSSGAALSWGNSWMQRRCDWRRRLLDVVGMHINVPQLTNKYLPCQKEQHQRSVLPCPTVGGLIAHHKWVGEFFLADPQGAHMCEYHFFVDKIKDEAMMRRMWGDAERHTSFLDYSPVLMHDRDLGWPLVKTE